MAQDHPVNSPAYHAVHNAQSPYYTGPKQQELPPPQPTGFWKKTWGAIAADGHKGVLGTFTGSASQQQAESHALEECRAKGGNCKVFTFLNQCAALVTGDNHYVMQGAESIDVASQIGLKECQKKDTGCRVYYSACTEPVFQRY